MTTPADQWWSINGACIMRALYDVAEGTSPEVAYIELLANSESEDFRE